MSSDQTFLNFFKLPVFLASFGGLPVPGAENLLPFSGIFRKLFQLLSLLAFIIPFTLMIDVFLVSFYVERYDAVKYFLRSATIMIFTGLSKNFYMVVQRKEWYNIIKLWDTSFHEPLFPDIRNDVLLKEKESVLKFIKWEYSILVFPVILWGFSPFITGKHQLESVLPWDHQHSPKFELTAIYHLLYGYFLTAMWSANDSFLLINMSLISAEIRYLRLSMKKILEPFKTADGGSVCVDGKEIKDLKSAQYEEIIDKMKFQLRSWTLHYGKLIRFNIRVRDFHSPLVLIHYLFFVVFCCSCLFFAASGMLPMLMSILGLMVPTSHGAALYIMCWFGEQISIQNQLLSEEIFGKDWFLLPKDIQSELLFIIKRVQKSILLSAFSFMPLNIRNFERMMKACYTFFMFIRDTSRKSRNLQNH